MPHMHKSSSKFTYVHDERNDTSFQAVDVHHILVRRSYTGDIMLYSIFLVLAVNTFYTFSEKEKPRTSLHWNLLLVVFLAASFRYNSIKKGSQEPEGDWGWS